jgi:hypothetical protein
VFSFVNYCYDTFRPQLLAILNRRARKLRHKLHTSNTTLSLYATCYYSVTFPCYERTNIQTCTSRKTKDEMRSPKLTTPTFTVGDSITILRMMFHYCPKHFTDSTPNLYLMFVGSWLRHCYGAKERNLKDGKYVQCVWFITTYISTNIPAHRVARWPEGNTGKYAGEEGRGNSSRNLLECIHGIPSVPHSWNKHVSIN